MDSLAFAHLVRGYFSSPADTYSAEDLHIFVLLTNEWLLVLNHRIDPPEAFDLVDTIVSMMADFTRFTLQTKMTNCGCYFNIPWPARLWNTRSHHLPALTANRHSAYLRLLHELERSHTEGLLTGPDVEMLPNLLRLTHDSYPGLCEVAECRHRRSVGTLSSHESRQPTWKRRLLPEVSSSMSAKHTWTDVVVDVPPPIKAEVTETFNFMLRISQGHVEVTREQVRSLVKAWTSHANRQTGFLGAGNIVPFLSVSVSVLLFKLLSG